MAQSQEFALVTRLKELTSSVDVIALLREIQNDMIGHGQKKEGYVRAGLLESLVATCKDSLSEQAKLHSIRLISSIAQGGACFLVPLTASGAFATLYAELTQQNSPLIVSTALGALLNAADAAGTTKSTSEINTTSLSDQVFRPQSSLLDSLASILLPQNPHSLTERHIGDIAILIAKLCRDPRHQYALAESPVLDALAKNLASVAVHMGYLVPGAETWVQSSQLHGQIPTPAENDANLGALLLAISAIIGESRYIAYRFLHCSAILSVFPNLEYDPGPEIRANYISLQAVGLGNLRNQRLGAMDCILPSLPIIKHKGASTPASTFPPLNSNPSFFQDHQPTAPNAPSIWVASHKDVLSATDTSAEDTESPVVPWLIHLAKVRQGCEKLGAADLLGSLCRAGLVSQERERAIGVLVIPPLLNLLSSLEDSVGDETSCVSRDMRQQWELLEAIPLVLARLVTDSELLQKAAHEANGVKMLSKLLKKTYEPLPDVATMQYWSPNPKNDKQDKNVPTSRVLGERGQFPLLLHRIRMRESILKAIAALASLAEDLRKEFVEKDILPFITESLNHVPEKPIMQKERGSPHDNIQYSEDAPDQPSYGVNTTAVVVAACHVIRILSRSVSVVRTSLFDNGVALPIFRLMRHRDLEVQVAATGAVCNLVTEIAPMRASLIEYGIMNVLCDHARSLDASLRLNALWALKNFVHSVPNVVKKACFERLTSGWLVQLISDDMEDTATFSRATEGMVDDIDEEMEDSPSAGRWNSQIAVLPQPVQARLETLCEEEKNPVRRARVDDMAIQEQGLNFIRNLIGSSDSTSSSPSDSQEATAMVEFLFQEVGPDRLFSILRNKLQIKVMHPFSNHRFAIGGAQSAFRDSQGQAGHATQRTRLVYPQIKIINAVIMILVHIAASVPRHRQLIVAQTHLLKKLVEQCQTKDKDVRLALCYLVSNIAWQDDMMDAQTARQRVLELKKLGFYDRLEAMMEAEDDLDVRERAKAAHSQMESVLKY